MSATQTMRTLVREFYSLESAHPTFPWVEIVPSAVNPADGPSRNAAAEIMVVLGVSTCQSFDHPSDLVSKLRT